MSRPRLPKKKISKSVTLKEENLKYATVRIGGGNLSLGLDLAVEFYRAAKQKEKEERNKQDKEELESSVID